MSDNEGRSFEYRRDEEAAPLESQVHAYIARTSMLQSRLLSTLDTLDARDRIHEREFSAVEEDRRRLKVKMQRCLELMKSAELERDDMRDAVIKLIEKVEMSNNYSNWPHSQITLSGFAGTDPVGINHSILQLVNEEDLSSYAASVIQTLRRERDNDRRAHAKTREASDTRIVELEAMLSRREVELESSVAHRDHPVSMKDLPSRPTLRTPQLEVYMSPEELIATLDIATTRNKVLEREVNRLRKRLEEALNGAVAPVTRSFARSSTGVNNLSEKNDGDTTLEADKLTSLESHINDLGSKIDAFVAERRIFCETIASSSLRQQSVDDLDLDNRLEMAELECDRLRRTEGLLRAQLNDTRLDAQQRETDLMAQINALSLAREGSPPPTAHETRTVQVQTSPPGVIADNLLDPNEGELPMELATPLMPTSVLAQSSSPAHVFYLSGQPLEQRNEYRESSYADPPSIPLPPSPEGLSAWEANSELVVSPSAFPLPPSFTPHIHRRPT